MALQKTIILCGEGNDSFCVDDKESDIKKLNWIKEVLEDYDEGQVVEVGVYELVRTYELTAKPTATLKTTKTKKG
jgi:hypothetical protein